MATHVVHFSRHSARTITYSFRTSIRLPFAIQCLSQTRRLHARIPAPPVPSPTPFVPDVETFLTLIGRKLSSHASKIPDWNALFTLTSPQLKNLGIEPPRARRYLLRWRDKFRAGEFGIGGDLHKVTDGIGEVRLVEVPYTHTLGATAAEGVVRQAEEPRATLTRSPGMRKVVLNVDRGTEPRRVLTGKALKEATPVQGVRQLGAYSIHGAHVELVKGAGGSRAVIKVKEGMWEHVRGHKVDGGERRKAETRAKRRAAERKAGRA